MRLFLSLIHIFSHSLFEEARKYGVRVVNLEPDMTDTNLYRNADFTVDENEAARIQPNEVADAVLYVLGQREGLVDVYKRQL